MNVINDIDATTEGVRAASADERMLVEGGMTKPTPPPEPIEIRIVRWVLQHLK
ncbi:MAG: hypothetical protein U0746_23180 [Gemmataceae bacterium]